MFVKIKIHHASSGLDLTPLFCSRSETLKENTKEPINMQLTWLGSA